MVRDEAPSRMVAVAGGREYDALPGVLLDGLDRGATAAFRAWEILRALEKGE